MSFQKRKRLNEFHKDQSGVFTIEASMLFPMILIITMCLIFFSLVVYHKSILQFQANRIADQVAYTWNNSAKDLATGEFDLYTTDDGGDGLYWRLTSNNFLSKFNVNFGGDSGLVAHKTRDELLSGVSGEGSITFDNGLFGSQVRVTIKQPVPLPSYVKNLLQLDIMEVHSTRTITEPVEFIRNVDFVVYFYNKIPQYGDYIGQFLSKKK